MMKNNQFNGIIASILVAVILFQCSTHAQYPDETGQYPDQTEEYPDQTAQYPDQTEQYPEQTTQYPDQTGDASGYGPAHLDTKHQFLAYQNAPRAAVGCAPLKWSEELANVAASYAEQRRSDCALIHSDGPLGENLFWGGGYGWTPAQAVKAWVDEGQYYDHSTNSCAPGQECGHYTQIVSARTTSVGCAMLQCDGDLGEFIICNYAPAGNYVGEKPY
ncbi:hypothetical protein MKX03_014989 [Papaver bracteatum]|nr:hypothetical protein MKX03_014989 [Papaver bracteatum]